MNQRPTIFDLEKASGFSRGTISRAFNGRPEVMPATRNKIFKKAAEIGYTPHSAARSMALGKTGRWGLIMPHLQNPFYGHLMEALDHQARQRKTMLLVALSHFDHQLENDTLRAWSSGEVDGIILSCHPARFDQKLLQRIHDREFPLVFLYERPSPDFDVILTDTIESLRRGMRCLVNFNHRRVAYLGSMGAPDLSRVPGAVPSSGPLSAYFQMLEQQGIPVDSALVKECAPESSAVRSIWRDWRELKNPPTAIVCFNDILACEVIHALKADGCRVPEDVSVLGNDDIPEAARHNLTTVRSSLPLMAEEIFGLLAHPNKQGETGRVRTITTEFVMRDSLAEARKGPLPNNPGKV